MTLPAGETVTRIRMNPGGFDRLGDPLPGSEEREDIPNCGLAPSAGTSGNFTDELTDPGRRAVADSLVLYLPPGAEIQASDRVEARGLVYEVDGNPGLWRSPYSGVMRGSQVLLTRYSEGTA